MHGTVSILNMLNALVCEPDTSAILLLTEVLKTANQTNKEWLSQMVVDKSFIATIIVP